MTNIYWPIYKNLESNVVELSYSIHIDDQQLNVYSSAISDVILRASAEIESISKELYKSNGGSKTSKIKYDTDAIEHLNSLWLLDQKIAILSFANCFQTKRQFLPFKKTEASTFHGQMTYSWNNSYQNLKHDRANSLHFGSLLYAFDIMAALFILNVYYKNDVYRDNNNFTSPSIDFGSELFSVKVHKMAGYDGSNKYIKNSDFDDCAYIVKYTDDSEGRLKAAVDRMLTEQQQQFIAHPMVQDFFKQGKFADYKGTNLMWDILGKNEYIKILNSSNRFFNQDIRNMEFEMILNKNDI